MNQRPDLSTKLSGEIFRSYYYLKEELVEFCRENGLPTSGGKIEITDRIAHFLDTGEILSKPVKRRNTATVGETDGISVGRPAGEVITDDMKIEGNFVCSEKHRAYFKEKIGKGFSFNVIFQKWLKSNTGKTYAEAVAAYAQIMEEKKKGKTTIDRQFEYNTYIRDFFADNEGRSLQDAIQCWNYKKSLQGHNRYERTDLKAIK